MTLEVHIIMLTVIFNKCDVPPDFWHKLEIDIVRENDVKLLTSSMRGNEGEILKNAITQILNK